MKYELWRLFLGGAIVFMASIGCGASVQAGLASSPSARRARPPRGQHDVISNGPESCDDQQPSKPYRQPPCAPNDPDSGVPVVPPIPEK